MNENEIEKILKDENFMKKSTKLAKNIAFLIQGENLLSGIIALSFVLKEVLKQQDIISEESILNGMKLCKDKEKGKND